MARSSSVRARPAGTPSIVTPSVRPCDSPAVRNRNGSVIGWELARPSRARPSAGRRSGLGHGVGPLAGGLAFGGADALGAGLGERLAHDLQRSWLAGPQRERGGTLVEQHDLAVHRVR